MSILPQTPVERKNNSVYLVHFGENKSGLAGLSMQLTVRCEAVHIGCEGEVCT
jgi:hypothetical protein